MSDTQNEPLPGEKAIKVKKAGPILLGADRYDIFEKGQKAIREFVEELFRFLIDFPGMMYLAWPARPLQLAVDPYLMGGS